MIQNVRKDTVRDTTSTVHIKKFYLHNSFLENEPEKVDECYRLYSCVLESTFVNGSACIGYDASCQRGRLSFSHCQYRRLCAGPVCTYNACEESNNGSNKLAQIVATSE